MQKKSKRFSEVVDPNTKILDMDKRNNLMKS